MSKQKQFESVWDALEDDPIRVENLKLRSALLIAINEELTSRSLKQNEAAELLHITQPRVSALKQGKVNDFRLDTLVDIAHRLGLHVSIEIAA
ncbi:MAG: XRE family transcriptional regulator [Candidatus Thiodiazotropha sp. (ex Dulcina madagascariensis)]|nr:XRE family transcriptional regulator [Candidatus Thiodiazotropha sp. (ex Dulcina madagascariensis)]MCU7926382.1 XRE family transcriptional regulator [Candidatus Thiodiazotropha sp. (ex Dulcina madagascariensis)]